jgi:hypothetical protein
MKVSIFICGDVVLSGKEDFLSDGLKDRIKNSDISICNLEGPIINQESKRIPKAGPHVFQSENTIKILKESGFGVFSLANNHIYDYGDEGLKNTLKEIGKYDGIFVGAGNSFEEAYEPRVIDINGIKIGLVALSECQFGCLSEDDDRSGYAWINHSSVNQIISELRKTADMVIVLSHAGVEEMPIPIKEWRRRYREFCDLGADIVIGHHPHVIQGFERYCNSSIYYSTGNFYFDFEEFAEKKEYAYSVFLEFDGRNKIKEEIIPLLKENGKLDIAENSTVEELLEKSNRILNDELLYEKISNQMCLWLYFQRYKPYYESVFPAVKNDFLSCLANNIIIRKFRGLIRKLRNEKKPDYGMMIFNEKKNLSKKLLLLHNLMIDSHRFVTQRALTLICEKGYNGKLEEFSELLSGYHI